IHDQAAFNVSWRKNSASATARAGLAGRFTTRQTAKAISRYSAPQTGPKTQSGGVKDGFASRAYQARWDAVASWPATEAANTAITASAPKSSLSRSFSCAISGLSRLVRPLSAADWRLRP